MDEPVPRENTDASGVADGYEQILYDTARVLAESPTLVDVAPRMLGAICGALDWQFGALWEVDHARKVLRCVGMWQPPSRPFGDFAAITEASTFAPGIGLPGRVWASRDPAWIPDVTCDRNKEPGVEPSGPRVVFMTVGHEDRLDRQTLLPDDLSYPGILDPRVDDDGLLCPAAEDDIGVGVKRGAEGLSFLIGRGRSA